MAEVGLSTLGIKVYAAEADNGGKASTGYSQITRVSSISGVEITPETIDASALEDVSKKYVAGIASVTDTLTITINLTNDTEAEWNAILGKQMCFMITAPGLTKAFFIIATVPGVLPMPSLEQNGVLTMGIGCTVNDFIGLEDAISVA